MSHAGCEPGIASTKNMKIKTDIPTSRDTPHWLQRFVRCHLPKSPYFTSNLPAMNNNTMNKMRNPMAPMLRSCQNPGRTVTPFSWPPNGPDFIPTGLPHPGHDAAFDDTSLPHSGHLIIAISCPPYFGCHGQSISPRWLLWCFISLSWNAAASSLVDFAAKARCSANGLHLIIHRLNPTLMRLVYPISLTPNR